MVFHQHQTATVGRAGYSPVGRPSCAPRSGVSLMEVLISIFVISIGLLGIAALIPVANYALVETSKSDRTAACGQAAMRDVRVRALADPTIWLTNTTGFANGDTYVLDPLGSVASYGTTPVLVHRIPYSAMTPAVADRIFRWRDDLLFDMREETSFRPRGFDLNNDGVPDGPIPEGSYSWMLTVTPSPAEDYDPAVRADGWRERSRLTVSVVVFYKRDMTLSADELVTEGATLLGGAVLELGNSVEFEPGQWILLVGQRANIPRNMLVALGSWYRVAGGSGRYLSLEGPNWTGVPGQPMYAVFVPDVAGVYTTSVELNRARHWLR